MGNIHDIFVSEGERHIGLALGGGSILGAAHIGVLRILEEHNVVIDHLSGTSVGAIIGSLIAFGKNSKDIEEIITDVRWINLSRLSFSKDGFLSQNKLAKRLREEIGDVTFKDAKIPFSVIATDISTGEKVIIKKGDVVNAVMASAAIPGIFRPIEIDGRLLVDGGVVENVPISPLREVGVHPIVAVSLNPSRNTPKNMIDIMINAFYFSIFQTTKLRIKEADILLEMNLSDYNMVSTRQIPSLIQAGYEQARLFIDGRDDH